MFLKLKFNPLIY